MIVVEIKQGFDKHYLEFPEAVSLEEAAQLAVRVISGELIYKTNDQVLALGKREFDYVRAFHQVDIDPNDAIPGIYDAADQLPEANPRINGRHLEYLGQKFILDVAEYEEGGVTYVMPFLLNGEPVAHMVGQTGMQAVAEQYIAMQRTPNPTIVLQHGPIIDETEALAFVVDFAAEDEAAREAMIAETEKTAKGFTWPKETGNEK